MSLNYMQKQSIALLPLSRHEVKFKKAEKVENTLALKRKYPVHFNSVEG